MSSIRSNSFSTRQSGEPCQVGETRNGGETHRSAEKRQFGEKRRSGKTKRAQSETESETESESESEQTQFGPDKLPKSNKPLTKPSKQIAAMAEYEDQDDGEEWGNVVTFDPLSLDGTDEEIPHHLHWDSFKGVLPVWLNHLHQCQCWCCPKKRIEYGVRCSL